MRSTETFRACAFAALAVAFVGCASHQYRKSDELALEKSCDMQTPADALSDDACSTRLAIDTAEAACRADEPDSCAIAYALITGSRGDVPTTASGEDGLGYRLAKHGCSLGDESSCAFEAVSVMVSGGAQGLANGKRKLEESCKRGGKLACHTLGTALLDSGVESEIQRGADLLGRMCDEKFATSCTGLAVAHLTGRGMAVNEAEARTLFARGCDLGDEDACGQIGRAVDGEQELMVADIGLTYSRYVELGRVACTNGYRHACTYVGHQILVGDLRSRYIDDSTAFSMFELGCENGAMASCMFAATMSYDGRGTEANTRVASEYAEKACQAEVPGACDLWEDFRFRLFTAEDAEEFAGKCEAGDGAACYLAGAAFDYGSNFPRDPKRAAVMFVRGCKLSDGGACNNAGLMAPVDKSFALFEKACGLQSRAGCHNAGLALWNGNGATRDPRAAAERFASACQKGLGSSCHMLGLSLRALPDLGGNASVAFERACIDGSPASCDELGVEIYRDEPDRALALWDFACNEDIGSACRRAAIISPNSDDPEDARRITEYFERACVLEDYTGCANLGRRYVSGTGVAQSFERGTQLLDKTCADGGWEACEFLGDALDADGENHAPDRALAAYDRGCELGSYSSCRKSALSALYDTDYTYDPDRALKTMADACARNVESACVFAGDLHQRGSHFERDRAKAAEYFRTGCEAGDREACTELVPYLFLGIGTDKDRARADAIITAQLERHVSICRSEGGWHCAEAAHLLAHGASRTDRAAAQEFLAARCAEGRVMACIERGEQLATGEIFDTDRNAAIAELSAACESGATNACEMRAQFWSDGDDRTTDLGKSTREWERLCQEGGANGRHCENAAFGYATGRGVEPDPARARVLFDKACNLETGSRCTMSPAVHDPEADAESLTKLNEHLTSTCERNTDWACVLLGDQQAYGLGTSRSKRTAAKTMEKACGLGNGIACVAAEGLKSSWRAAKSCDGARQCTAAGLAAQYDARDFAKAAQHFDAGCDAGGKLACRLRFALHSNMLAPLEGARRAEVVQRGCTEDTPEFCYWGGYAISRYDWEAGTPVIQTACASGYDEACLFSVRSGVPLPPE